MSLIEILKGKVFKFTRSFKVGSNEKLLLELKKKKPHIIGVDGEAGIGKSTEIAPFLQEQLDGVVVSLDCYLEEDRGGYLKYLRYDQLRRDISDLMTQPKLIIIEGIMLLDVLERMGINQDYLIYACGKAWFEDWTSEYGNRYNCLTLEEIIRHEDDMIKIVKRERRMPDARKELYAYTYKWRPFFRADAIWISS